MGRQRCIYSLKGQWLWHLTSVTRCALLRLDTAGVTVEPKLQEGTLQKSGWQRDFVPLVFSFCQAMAQNATAGVIIYHTRTHITHAMHKEDTVSIKW